MANEFNTGVNHDLYAATPPSEFGMVARDETRNEIYTLDRVQGVLGRIHFEQANPRYEIVSGDYPDYDFVREEWTTTPFGHGPSLDGARGFTVDEAAGCLYVSVRDRVVVVDVETQDRVIALVLE